MSSELGVSSELRQSTARLPPLNIGDLPQDVLNQIFRRLSPRDLQAAALASRGMNHSVKEAAHFHEFHSIKKFIRILMQKLPEQKEWLAKIAQNIVFQNFANLLLLKGFILDVKAQLIGVIKTVDVGTVKGLHHDIRPPHFLENIFRLAVLERQIDAAHLIPNEYRRWKTLRDISKALARAGAIDRSLEVATSIAEDGKRWNAFWYISKALAQKGDIDRSLEVATSTPDEGTRGCVLRDISEVLTRAGNRDKALAVAWLIPNKYMRCYALRDISKALAQKGDIDGSLTIAWSIPDEDARGVALRDISQALADAGNIERATAVARLIPDESMREEALRDISSLQ